MGTSVARRLTTSVMNTFLDTAVVSEALVQNCDTKLAIWSSLLPACKKDPLRLGGQVDEVMYVVRPASATGMAADDKCDRFMAHMCAAM